ncbi:MAG: hypothetical protein JOY54_10935 [Acidobacteriaceae bacterium]|nr:hypothetical protein [Acidobacteriaceae bacterium]
MVPRTAIGLLLAVSLHAAEFQNGQAARAVIGQPGFSAHEPGISALALSLGPNRLYAADGSNHIQTFDLTRLPGPKEDMTALHGGVCSLCGFSPVAVAPQRVFPGLAGFSAFGKTVVAADPATHRVLIWRDTSIPHAGPDLILGRSEISSPISGTTLVNPVSVAFDGKRLFVGDASLHRVLIWNSLPFSSDQPADVVLGQPDFSSAEPADSPRADNIRLPAALASDGTNLYVADPPDRRIIVFTPGDTSLASSALVNSATLSNGPVAPGTLVTIRGAGLSFRSEAAAQNLDEKLPLKLAGVEVIFNGAPVPLLSVSPEEIQGQVPYSTDTTGSASVYIRQERADGSVVTTNAIPVNLVPASPGLFAFAGKEPRLGILLHGDANAAAGTPITQDSPAFAGETLTLWATGLGPVSDPDAAASEGVPFTGEAASVIVPVSASINGRSAEVVSATLPEGAIGVYEVRVALPPELAADPKAQLVLTQHGISSNTILFSLQTNP